MKWAVLVLSLLLASAYVGYVAYVGYFFAGREPDAEGYTSQLPWSVVMVVLGAAGVVTTVFWWFIITTLSR